MKRLSILVLLIGFAVSSVSIAKGHEPVYVSVSDQDSHYEAITTVAIADYISLETGEVIKQYADAVVCQTLESNNGEVFHPPASYGNITLAANKNYTPSMQDIRKFRRDMANGYRC
jgi:hypothetical protein